VTVIRVKPLLRTAAKVMQDMTLAATTTMQIHPVIRHGEIGGLASTSVLWAWSDISQKTSRLLTSSGISILAHVWHNRAGAEMSPFQ
jgi:hypothetical protein